MPYRWIEPELFLEGDGTAVYHCYDDAGDRCQYWYTTDVTDDNAIWIPSDSEQFDVRDLPNLGLDANDTSTHARIIQDAIRAGLLSGEPAAQTPVQVVTIEVAGGVVQVLDKPPDIAVEIIDRDVQRVERSDSYVRPPDG